MTIGVRNSSASRLGFRGAIDFWHRQCSQVFAVEDEPEIEGARTNGDWQHLFAGVPKIMKCCGGSISSKEDHGFGLAWLEIKKPPQRIKAGDDCGRGKFGPFQGVFWGRQGEQNNCVIHKGRITTIGLMDGTRLKWQSGTNG